MHLGSQIYVTLRRIRATQASLCLAYTCTRTHMCTSTTHVCLNVRVSVYFEEEEDVGWIQFIDLCSTFFFRAVALEASFCVPCSSVKKERKNSEKFPSIHCIVHVVKCIAA